MNRRIFFSLITILCLIASTAKAETLHNKRGFTYENVTIKEVTLERVKISHDSGLGWVDLEDLKPESKHWVELSTEYQNFRRDLLGKDTIQKTPLPEIDFKFPEIRLSDGRILKDVTVRKKTMDSVSFQHNTGSTTVPFELLSAADANTLGFTAEGVRAAREDHNQKELIKAHLKLRETLATTTVDLHFLRVQGKILQVLSNGVLLTQAETWDGRFEWWDDPFTDMRQHLAITKKINSCYVQCDTNEKTDGQYLSIIVGEAGTFSYSDIMGSSRTVKSYTSDLAQALKQWFPNADEDVVIEMIKKKYHIDRMSYKLPIPSPAKP